MSDMAYWGLGVGFHDSHLPSRVYSPSFVVLSFRSYDFDRCHCLSAKFWGSPRTTPPVSDSDSTQNTNTQWRVKSFLACGSRAVSETPRVQVQTYYNYLPQTSVTIPNAETLRTLYVFRSCGRLG